MVGRFLVGFVWLNLVFCVMVGRLLVGFVWLNLQFSVSWLVDFQWGSCGSIFSFLCHGWQTFSGVRVAQSLVFCVMIGRLLVGFVWLNLQFCVMVGRLLVGFVWLNLQFSVSWLVDFQWGSCGSIFSFLCHGWQTFSGFVWLNLQFSVSWLVDFQWGSCGSIFSFLCHGWQTFSGVRVAQSLVFCVMVGRLLVGFVWLNLQVSVSWYGRLLAGFVWLNLQFSVSWLVDFQWGSCGSIFSFVSWLVDFQWGSCGSIFCFLCHGWQTFSGVRVAQSLVFCFMVGRFLVGFVWLNLVFCVMVGRLLVGFVWLNLQFSVSWEVDFQRGSCGSIFSFLCHGWQTFSGVRVAQSLVLCHGWYIFIGVRVVQSLVFCVMLGRLLVGFVWLNLQFSVSCQVDFQWGSCGSIFTILCHGWQTVSGLRVAQSLVFYVMVGRLLVGFVWLNLQFSVSWQVDFQWVSCRSIFSFLCHGWQTFSGVRVAQSLVLCHDRQTFSGVRVAQSLVLCVMVDRLLVGFVWFNLQFSVS